MENFDTLLAAFVAGCKRIWDEELARSWPDAPEWEVSHVDLDIGPRYVRVIKRRGPADKPISRSAFAFVDKTDGNVYKPKGYAGPAKGMRGNIADAKGGLGMVGPYGMGHLR